MGRKKLSKGKCAYCGQEIAKNGAAKHLGSCSTLQDAKAKAELKKIKDEPIFHLRVQAGGIPEFWLNLEMRGSAKLQDLDNYLRAIWLECCGHLSQFSFGGWEGEEISMTRRLADVLEVGEELTHIYDFGTSSTTLIKAVGIRQGRPLTTYPITLLMRNVMPESVCIECEQPAAWFCSQCSEEYGVFGTLCDEHAKTHPHDEYGEPMPLVNSPRMGACAYTGPAEPPY